MRADCNAARSARWERRFYRNLQLFGLRHPRTIWAAWWVETLKTLPAAEYRALLDTPKGDR